MKKLLSLIRWKFVLPVVLIVSSILIFFIIFFDPIAGRVLEKVASRMNEAKVDVQGFRTKLFKGRVSIDNLQVTDKSNPMTNIVEAGPLAFQLDFTELFSKRVIINEATLKGLSFGTARKKSGALPKKIEKKKETESEKPSVASKLAEKYQDRFKLQLGGMKTEVKSRIDFDPENLEIARQANELKEKANNLPNEWEEQVNTLDVDGRLQSIEQTLKSIKDTPTQGTEALTAIPANLKKLKEAKEALDKLKSDVKAAKEKITSDIKTVQSDISGLKDAKKKDVDDLLSRLNLDFADPDRLVEGIIGRVVMDRFQTALHYANLARQHMPSQKERQSLPPKPRAQGMDIEFPTPAALPRFWLMSAALEGVYDGISASGIMTDATTDPTRIGKPFKLNLNGQKETQKFQLQALFDHVGDNSKDSITANLKGINVKEYFSQGSQSGLLSEGSGDVDIAISLLGEGNLGGQIGMKLSALKFDDQALFQQLGVNPASTDKEELIKIGFAKNMARAIENVPQVEIMAQLFGTWQDPSLKITSNLAATMSKAIKDSFGNLVQDQKKELEAKLDAILKEKSSELSAKLGTLQGPWKDKLAGFDTKIEEEISKATGIQLGSSDSGGTKIPGIKIPSLDKLFKK